jgi:mannose-6-phosphate isomerase-like protein (cupin superfamily)
MKTGYHTHIEQDTLANTDFRRVLYTGQHLQLVLMALQPREEIGLETHADNDQFFRFESGEGRVVINDIEYVVTDGDVVIVPAGAQHNIVNISETELLKLYTLYTPPHHADGIVRATRGEAMEQEAAFDGVTTE